MKIILCGSEASSVMMFRGDLVRDLVTNNHEVIIMANNASSQNLADFASLGAKYISAPISRTSLNPLKDINVFFKYLKVFSSERPDCVLSYTIKPVIWSGIALRFFPKIRYIGMITGLGYAFGKGDILRSITRFVAIKLYKFSLDRCKWVIFQNCDNKKVFVDSGLVDESKAELVQGSGVNLVHFSYMEPNMTDGRVSFLMVARLLGDKGIREFLAAAKIVKNLHNNVDFILVGPEDSSPDSIPLKEVMNYEWDGVISYIASVSDIRQFVIDCSVFVLPSYHEGMPRAVLEAMAVGRPIITTDVPGCRETVINGINGWLVPKCSVNELSRKMVWFINQTHEIEPMGKLSRDMAERQFDVAIINRHIIKIITRT